MVNAVLARNVADTGAALYLIDPSGSGMADVIHVTIASPTANSGSAIYVGAGTAGITNTIISGYTTDIAANSGATATVDYSLTGSAPVWTGAVSDGGHNVTGDLGFADPGADDYHLAEDSAAIDHGVDAGISTDLDGSPRPVGAGFDIGAYETEGWRYLFPIIMHDATL